MRKIALFLAIFISCFGYELGELKNIVKTDGVSGNFTQTKSLAGFNKSIKSSGEFRLEKGGLYWDTLEPVVSKVFINKDGIFKNENGKLEKTSANFDEKLFLAIISLDESELRKEFDIKASGSLKEWSIELIPKNLLFKQIFKSIKISGDKAVKKIELDEVSGDKTLNEFSIK